MELTPRLQMIADSINNCEVMADIGSDHAYLPIYLTKNKKAKRAIASDVNKGPVETAKKRIKGNNADDAVDVRHGNGLEVLKPGEADVIVIAGMGGILMTEILSGGKDITCRAGILVLQPMRDSDKVRRWLCENGFDIVDEELVKEDYKIYEIIWARPQQGEKPAGERPGCGEPMYIGKKILEKKHPLAAELVARRIGEYEKVMAALKGQDTANSRERMEECRTMLDYYGNVAKLLYI